MNTTPETPEAPAVTPAVAQRLDEIVTAGKVASKKGKARKARGKARRFRRARRSPELRAEVRLFWRWEELYTNALNMLIQSLAVGRKMTPAAMVNFARDVADKGTALHEARRPKDDPRGE